MGLATPPDAPAERVLLRRVTVTCALAVAAFLVARLTAWPPHEDETLVLSVGRAPLAELLETVLGERGGAPLHFVLAWLLGHAGGGLVGLRLLSAICAVASVVVIAELSRRIAGARVAAVATVLASASWILLFHGIYGRMYSLFLLTSALSYLALLRALRVGGMRGWAPWAAAALAVLATHPYGALVLASQALYVVLAWERVRQAVAAFAVVGVLATPFWMSSLVLADRFDVAVGPGAGKLAGPLDVLAYLTAVAGDMSAGWPPAVALVLVAAGVGAQALARERPHAALLAASVVAAPTLAFLLARLGASASPESRHLIFALPLFATLVAAGLLALLRPQRALAAAVALALVQVAWAWSKTPALFTGEPTARVEARERAAAWLAAGAHPDDVLLGYEPVYLEAAERSERLSRRIVPRADAVLAVRELRSWGRLGRGVWVFDASDTNNVEPSERIELRLPRPAGAFEARAFGPYLVIRTREPVVTAQRWLQRAAAATLVGRQLDIGDADVNFATLERAALLLPYRVSVSSRSTASR